MKKTMTSSILFIAFWMILIFPRDSMAYIDPGSGFILLQVLVATAVGSFFAFKRFWLNLLRKLPFISSAESKENKENSKEN